MNTPNKSPGESVIWAEVQHSVWTRVSAQSTLFSSEPALLELKEWQGGKMTEHRMCKRGNSPESPETGESLQGAKEPRTGCQVKWCRVRGEVAQCAGSQL